MMALQGSFTTSASKFVSLTPMSDLFIDPQYGNVGAEIVDQLDAMGCIADILPQAKRHGGSQQEQNQASSDNDDAKTVAGYLPFIFTNVAPEHRTPGTEMYSWENAVQFDPAATEEQKLISLGHEGGAHALSWNRAPILHASPSNGYDPSRPDIVVAPSDAVRLIFATEQIGYADQAWLTSLAARSKPEFNAAASRDPIKPAEFENLRTNAPDLRTAMVEAANIAMDRAHTTAPDGTTVIKTFGQHYVDVALRSYENSLRLSKFPQGITFVRMEYADMLPAGHTVGPNILEDQNLAALGDLEKYFTPDIRARIAKLNERLGINEEELPTFAEALADVGHTPESYLELSKTRPAVTHKPAPAEQDTYIPSIAA